MIAPTSGSSRASSSACEISTIVCGRNALRTSGRSTVSFAIPSPDVSYRMSSYSAAGVHMAAHHTSGMPIDAWLPRAVAMRPERVAIEAPEGSLTYAELLSRARLDVAPGTRVPLEEPPGLEFVVRLHAILLAGAAAVPVDDRLGEAERAALAAGGAATPGTALVVHTSGTTGAPRPVEISFENVHAN